MIFDSRPQAGKLLAEELRRRKIKPDVVFGLTRGGMAVAAEVAKILGVELRPLIVRKIGAPGNPEFAVGAAAEIPKWEVSQTSQQQIVRWDRDALKRFRLDEKWQKQQILDKKLEISEYIRKLEIPENSRRPASTRVERGEPSPKSGNIVLVDDGAATGISMLAALEAIQTAAQKGLTLAYAKVRPYQIIVALPVASVEAAEMLKKNADEVVILHPDPYLGAVGIYYRQFEQVSWEKVKQLLESSYETNQKTN